MSCCVCEDVDLSMRMAQQERFSIVFLQRIYVFSVRSISRSVERPFVLHRVEATRGRI